MEKLDYKKEYKDLYCPKPKPMLIDVPNIKFIAVQGKGNPNNENGEYQEALSILYALSFTIKMSKMGNNKIDGYFEYVVPPLEGLWWNEDNKNVIVGNVPSCGGFFLYSEGKRAFSGTSHCGVAAVGSDCQTVFFAVYPLSPFQYHNAI